MDRFKGLKIGIQSFTFRKYDIETMVQRTKELGLNYLEVGRQHLKAETPGADIDRLLKACADHGVQLITASVGGLGPDVEKRPPGV